MSLFSSTHDQHRECWDLLPWVANERIASHEWKRIEAHLSTCDACQKELAAQRALRELIRADEAIVIAPQSSFQKLLHRIDGEEIDASVRSPVAGPASSGREQTQSRPRRATRWLAIAAGIQALAIGVLLAMLAAQHQSLLTAPRFATLTAPASAPAGPVIRVVFQDDVTIGELNQIVRALGAHIVAGPNSAGVYTLQLAGEQRTSAELEQVAAQLRRDERVMFSEPAVAEITAR